MKIKKSLFSACLSILFIVGFFVPSINVYAAGDSWSNQMLYGYFNDNFYKIEKQLDGIIWNIEDLQQSFYDYIEDQGYTSNSLNYQTWIGDHMSGTYQNGDSGVSDISFDQTLRQALRSWSSAYIEANTGYKYVYSFGSAQYRSPFSSDEVFNKFLNVFNENSNSMIIVNHNGNDLYVFDNDFDIIYSNYSTNYAVYSCNTYYNGQLGVEGAGKHYFWSTTTSDYQYTTFNSQNIHLVNLKPESYGSDGIIDRIDNYQLTDLNPKAYLMYMSKVSADNDSQGIKDYYISDSYNSTISGSYNTTTNVIDNSVTSSQVNNYINNYYTDNGDYPTPQEIYIYINNYIPDPDPTPDPSPSPTPDPGGGGSGSDDDEEDESGFWQLIKKVLDFVSKLFDTIAGFLADLVDSLGDVVTAVIDNIFDIISSIKDGIPNIIGDLLEYLLPFLPEELITVIVFSITLTIIVGIIKLLRG